MTVRSHEYALTSPFISDPHDHAVVGVVCRPEASPTTPKPALVPVAVPVLHRARRWRAALLRERARDLRWWCEAQRRGADLGGSLAGVEERERRVDRLEEVARGLESKNSP